MAAGRDAEDSSAAAPASPQCHLDILEELRAAEDALPRQQQWKPDSDQARLLAALARTIRKLEDVRIPAARRASGREPRMESRPEG